MVERVIFQSQREHAEMNRSFLKWVFFIGTFIIGIIILKGGFNFTFENLHSNVSKIWGIIWMLPMIIWLGFKIKKKIDKSKNYSSHQKSRYHQHHYRHRRR